MTVVIRTFLTIGRTFSIFFSLKVQAQKFWVHAHRGVAPPWRRVDRGVFWHYSEQSSPRGHNFAISLGQGWPCNLSVPQQQQVPHPCSDSTEPGGSVFAPPSMLFLLESAHQAPLVLPIPKASGYVAKGIIQGQIPYISATSHPGSFLNAEPSLEM